MILVSSPAPAQEELLGLPAAEDAPPARGEVERVIEVDADAADDAAIRRRLEGIFGSIDGLAGIAVGVEAGVVTLSGEVGSQELDARASRLAGQVEGVVEVEDRVGVTRDLGRRIGPAVERLSEAGRDVLASLPVLLAALAIMAGFVLLARLVVARLRVLWRSLTPNTFLSHLLSQAVQAAVILAGAFVALLLLDATWIMGGLLGAAGVLGLALGFALRDTVENLIASILLSLRRPFGPNDHVVIEGHEGRVSRLTSRATVLLTLDGNHVRIPNATVFKGITVNYSENPSRRFSFDLGVAADADLTLAQKLAMEELEAMPGVLDEPPPLAVYTAVGDSDIRLRVTGWLDQNAHDFFKIRSEAIRLVVGRLSDAGVDLPEPTLRLREGPPARPRAEAPAAEGSGSGREAPVIDIDRDRTLDGKVAQDRREKGDLLDADAPRD